MINDGSIEKVIQDGIKKSIEKAISRQFESYGSITKQIEGAIENGLQINFKDLPFETYNQQMLVAVKTKLGNMFVGAASEKFMSEMDKILKPAPKEMSINEFVETIVGFWKSDDPYHDTDIDEYATVEINEKEALSGVTLKMWDQLQNGYSLRDAKNSPKIELYIIDGKIRISHNHKYNPTCFHEHEAFVFKLYAAGTVLTEIEDFDPDSLDLCLKDMDY
jgi:hypothetical protein